MNRRASSIRRIFLTIPVLLGCLGQLSVAQYGCPQEVCNGGDCWCASRLTPGAFPHDQVPQFIVVTFDDGINVFSESLIQPVIGGLVNPDGAPAPVTYYVTKVNTTPAVARARYLAGNELANHTSTHTTGNETTLEVWRRELSETNQFLVNQVGMPSDQIAGFRAPYLMTNEAMWRVLQEERFTYDASLTEFLRVPRLVSASTDSLAWPHTLDNGSGLACLTNHCPDTPLPGMWSMPLWTWYDSAGVQYGAMDPAVGYDSIFAAILQYNFQQRYTGNRCPLGICMHAGQLGVPGRQQVLRAFLEEKLKQPDVWMITARGLVEWMRSPVPVSGLAEWFQQGRHRGIGRMAAAPPPAPVLVSPSRDTAVALARVPLNWEVLLSASAYQVQVSPVPDVSVAMIDTLLTQGTILDVSGLASGVPVYWRVRAVNTAGPGAWSEVRRFTTVGSTGVAEERREPGAYRLEQSYPNPFNPSTTIAFTLPAGVHATLRVYNALGMEVATLVDAALPAGTHEAVWNASHHASGVYVYQLQAGSFRAMRRMLLLK